MYIVFNNDGKKNCFLERMRRMKRILSVGLIIILVLSIAGCGNGPADDKFLSDLESGLVARWDKSDSTESYAEPAQVEYDYIKEYKNAEFEDAELGKLANAYIAALETQLSVVDYYDSDYQKFAESYFGEDGLVARADLLQTFVDKGYLIIPKEYEDSYNGVISNANEVKIMNALEFGEVKITDEYKEHEFYDFEIEVTNTSDKRITGLSLQLDVYDENDVKISSGEIYDVTLEPGSKGISFGQVNCNSDDVSYYKIVSVWDLQEPNEFGIDFFDLFIPITLK